MVELNQTLNVKCSESNVNFGLFLRFGICLMDLVSGNTDSTGKVQINVLTKNTKNFSQSFLTEVKKTRIKDCSIVLQRSAATKYFFQFKAKQKFATKNVLLSLFHKMQQIPKKQWRGENNENLWNNSLNKQILAYADFCGETVPI